MIDRFLFTMSLARGKLSKQGDKNPCFLCQELYN